MISKINFFLQVTLGFILLTIKYGYHKITGKELKMFYDK